MSCGAALLLALTTAAAGAPAQSSASAPEALVVAIEARAELHTRLLAIDDWSAFVGSLALSPLEAKRRLTGLDEPRHSDIGAVRALLSDAAQREAHFDTQGADSLRREVLAVYDNLLRSDDVVRDAAAQALQDRAAAAQAEGRNADALVDALEAVRRFPSYAVDLSRHPPRVEELYEQARAVLRSMPQGALEVTAPHAGELFADGRSLGRVVGRQALRLPLGRYRLWLRDHDRISWVHPVEISPVPAQAHIDLHVESAVSWEPFLTLRCADDCPSRLEQLGQRARVAQVVGLKSDGQGGIEALVVDAVGGGVALRTLAAQEHGAMALAPRDVTLRRSFSPLYLVPLGVGQLAQDRTGAALGYAALQIGLAIWHTTALIQHHTNAGDTAREPELRRTRNLSGGLLLGAMTLNVLEAVVVGLVTGE